MEKGRAVCSERTRGDNLEIKASADLYKESDGGIANAGVAESKEDVAAAGPQLVQRKGRRACTWQGKLVAKEGEKSRATRWRCGNGSERK